MTNMRTPPEIANGRYSLGEDAKPYRVNSYPAAIAWCQTQIHEFPIGVESQTSLKVRLGTRQNKALKVSW
jgi:hypothetical protein